MTAFIVDIRDRRQVTVPKAVLTNFGLSIGDKLLFDVDEGEVKLTPVVNKINDTLKSISNAFSKADVSKEDLLESGEKIRKDLVFEKYGIKK